MRLTSLDNRERRYLNSMARNLILDLAGIWYPGRLSRNSSAVLNRFFHRSGLDWHFVVET